MDYSIFAYETGWYRNMMPIRVPYGSSRAISEGTWESNPWRLYIVSLLTVPHVRWQN